MTEYVMGVDHGGTKTSALIGDSRGHLCASVTLYKSREPSYERLEVTARAMEQALVSAGLLPEQIACCTVGYSGADWDFEFPLIRQALADATGISHPRVVNDCIGAMRGGTQLPYGGVICIGTGLNIGLIDRNGRSFVYGYLINDEDSGGVALGQRVVRAVRNAYTGVGQPTVLTEKLLAFFRKQHIALASVYDFFVADSTGAPSLPILRYEVKDLTPLLLQAADEGDAVAGEIVADFCGNVRDYVTAAARRLSMTEEPFDLILTGGVLKGGKSIRCALERLLQEAIPNMRLVPARYEPVCGDALLSYDALRYGETVRKQFEMECDRAGLRLGL